VDGQGTQMSMLHNFGRGFLGDVIGPAALDCGSASVAPIAKSWICRGIVADEESNGVSEAREIRLKRVKARKNPQCRTVKLDPS